MEKRKKGGESGYRKGLKGLRRSKGGRSVGRGNRILSRMEFSMI